jgi:8-oxo-dGTP pyrophosphatase MutT (NUDIX family)
MKKFSKHQKIENDLPKSQQLYKGNKISIVNFDEWEMADESDMIIVLPYMKDRDTVLLRSEYIPTYRHRNLRDKAGDRRDYLTVICGTMEPGEKPEQTIRRELYEEAGVVLSSVKNIEIEDSVFLNKGNMAKFHCCLIEIGEGEYKQTIAPGDGSKAETLSKTIEIPAKDINQLVPSDLATKHLLLLFKYNYPELFNNE